MKVLEEQMGETVLLTLSGEVVSRDDQQAVSQLIEQKLGEGTKTFVMDLSEVPYVSSLGITVFVAAYVKINRGEGKLRLVNPRPKVARVLEMTRLSDMFTTYASVEEALSTV